MDDRTWKILLVEDDEDDYVLARALLAEAKGSTFQLTWARNFALGLKDMLSNQYDAILLDYDLGPRNGLELFQEASARGCKAPVIMLTGRGSYEIDVEAMRGGVADYLTKSDVNAPLLERTIRYAIERKQNEDALRQAHDELELRVQERTHELARTNQELHYQAYLLENVNDAIIAVDAEFRRTAWNRAAEQIYGWKAEEVLGRPESEILQTELIGVDNQEVLRSLAETGQFQGVAVQYRKDGQPIYVEIKSSAMKDETGRITGYVSVNRDITERKRVEAELAEVQRRLTESRESERLHLAQELHDGPVQDLLAISYQMKSLQDESLEADQWTKLDSLQEQMKHIVRVLRGVTRDLRPPTLAPFGLQKTIRSHAELFQQEHPEIQVRLDLEADGLRLPEQVRLALFRIYQHALINVLRHSKAHQVMVRLMLEDDQVTLEIEDDGDGFAVPGGWIDFVRGGHLGLAGAAERAEAVGGRFIVNSCPGSGTCLRVIVPL